MNDKKGPAVAWVCAVLATLLSLLVAASAARTVHAAPLPSDSRHAVNRTLTASASTTL